MQILPLMHADEHLGLKEKAILELEYLDNNLIILILYHY